MGSKNPLEAVQFLIIEVEKTSQQDSMYPANSIVVNELRFYDKSLNVIPYTTTEVDAYDISTNNVPYYWNRGSIWNRNNLNNGKILYADVNSTGFLGDGTANSNGYGWARFLVLFPSYVELGKIATWCSSQLNRDIHILRVYAPLNNVSYDKTTMLNQRSNTSLELKWELINDYSQRGDGVSFTKDF